jgi:hypothetical protein
MTAIILSPEFLGNVFLFASATGISVLVLATALSFFGFDDHIGGGDAPVGPDVFSVRALSTALAAFGLSGYGLQQSGFWAPFALSAAVFIGLASGLAVAYLLRGMTRMEADGSVKLDFAIGEAATVYIAIPENGTGRITLSLQGQTVECDAISMDGPLKPGTKVLVTNVLDGEVLEVQAYPSLKELA